MSRKRGKVEHGSAQFVSYPSQAVHSGNAWVTASASRKIPSRISFGSRLAKPSKNPAHGGFPA